MSFTKLLDSNMMPRHLFIDSKDSIFKLGKNEYLFELPEVIRCNRYHDMYVGLTSATIPIACYNIKDGQNQIDIKLEKSGTPTQNHSIVIPSGNYNLTQMLQKFDEVLTTEMASTPIAKPVLAWSSNSNKVSLTCASDVTITLLDTSTGLRLLGFTDSVHGGVNNIVISDSLVDIRNTLSIYIKSDIVTTHVSTTHKHARNDILAKIPVVVGNFDSVNYTTSTPNIIQINGKSIKAFKITLEDEEHNPLDINSMNWSCVLCIYFAKVNPNAPPVAMSSRGYIFENNKKPPTGLLRDEIDDIYSKYNLKEVSSRMEIIETKNNIFI